MRIERTDEFWRYSDEQFDLIFPIVNVTEGHPQVRNLRQQWNPAIFRFDTILNQTRYGQRLPRLHFHTRIDLSYVQTGHSMPTELGMRLRSDFTYARAHFQANATTRQNVWYKIARKVVTTFN